MNMDEKENNTIYKVVLNHEEQYSIWPVDRENPLGWMILQFKTRILKFTQWAKLA